MRIFVFGSCLLFSTGCWAQNGGVTPRPFVDTWNGIHLHQVFDYKISDFASIARFYDFVWGVEPWHVSDWRNSNPNIFLTYYIPFSRDRGTFSNSTPGTLAYWQQVNPDWVLYTCDKMTPAYMFNAPNVPLDFTNPAVINWQVQSYAAPASQAGFDGIAADNTALANEFGACGVYRNGQWVQLFSGQAKDPLYANAVVSWLAQMQQALHKLYRPLALVPNFQRGSYEPSDPLVGQLLSYVDGILNERGHPPTDENFLPWLQFIVRTQQKNVPFYQINQFSAPVSNSDVEWALATYLLSKERLAGLWVSGFEAGGADTRYPAYNVQIGTPMGEMYAAQSVYWRNHTGGLVVVNPSSKKAVTVTTSAGPYQDAFGNPLPQTFTLPPASGKLLRPAQANQPCFQYINVLAPNGTLPAGACILANNHNTMLTMQDDGNLVVYDAKGRPLWASNTLNPNGNNRAVMQGDGSLVVYSGLGKALWSSGTGGHSDAFLTVQDDGNVVVYADGGRALWATGTH